MRNLLHRVVLFLLCLPMLSLQAKDVYGYMTGNGNIEKVPIGMYRFDTETLDKEILSSFMGGFWGGAFAVDTYYFIYSSDYQGYIYNGLSTMNLDNRIIGAVDQSQPYQCSDMTYDVTTSTMYGLQVRNAGENYPHTLITIDLKSGAKTNVGEVATPMAGIACNNWGEMYGIGYDGNLYEIDKGNASLKLVGPTGIMTDQEQAQSMEFDRDSGMLYWTCLDNNQDALLVKLDIYSEKLVVEQKIMKDNALIVGLHIPTAPVAPDAPAPVAGLDVQSQNGQVVLSWTNPSLTEAGQALNALSKIEIVRNNQVVHTLNAASVGAAMHWEDKQADNLGGNVRYAVYAYNEAGKSQGVSKKLIVGDDVPGSVTDFKLTADGAFAQLSWKAPETGKNGGKLTAANLRYKLTRMPDKKVFDGISGTTFTDETIENSAYYSYTIVCYNQTGNSDEAVTETLAVGNPIEAPYATDFSNETLAAQWQVINANNDNTTWQWKNGKFVYSFCFSNDGDDHLVSVPFHLEKGINYAVKYTIEAPSMFSNPEHFAIKVGDQVIEDLEKYNNNSPEVRTADFTVTESGNYAFTLSALSPKDNWQIAISRFEIEKMVPKDLEIANLTASTEELQEGVPATLAATLTNKGIETANSYTVVLTDQNQNILFSQTYEEALAKGEEKTVTFDWNPTKEVHQITATVQFDGDVVADNNTVQLPVYVLGKDESYLAIGEKDSKPYFFPFSFDGQKYSYSQTIYSQEMLGMKQATINGICYEYNNYGADLPGKHVKVYLTNTEESSLKSSGWFADVDMTLVFDGIVDFVRGKNTLRMVFDEPFEYNGQNLAIYTQKLDDETVGDIHFYAKNYGGQEAMTTIYAGNTPEVALNLVKGSTMINHVIFRVQQVDTGLDHVTAESDYGMTLQGNRLSLNQEVESIAVYDMNGRLIARQQYTSQVDLSGCAAGVYLVNITNGQDQLVKKIIR